MHHRTRLRTGALALLIATALASPRYAGAATSTAPSSTTGATIGYVGCSNTWMTVDGVHRLLGDTRLWPALPNYGGGTVQTWARSIGDPTSRYWTSFSTTLAAFPTHTFWIEVCAKAKENLDPGVLATEASSVIAEMRRRVPQAVIYVSAINGYAAPHICSVMPQGAGPMTMLATTLVSQRLAVGGPAMGDLSSIYPTNVSAGATPATNETVLDGCHPNELGERHLASQLKAFVPFAG